MYDPGGFFHFRIFFQCHVAFKIKQISMKKLYLRQDSTTTYVMIWYYLSMEMKLFEKGGKIMKEQEWYKHLLKKMITESENQKINTAEEMIKTLINEISISKTNLPKSTQAETASK